VAEPTHDAVVVGSGPNGLAAAIAVARAGRSVLVLEGAATVGGGTRSEELTLPGYVHDVCSAVHPLVAGSPFLGTLPLADHGLELLHPDVPLAHPLDGGTAVVLDRSLEATAASIGGADGTAYTTLMEPLVRDAAKLLPVLLGPLRPPRHPMPFARFGLSAVRSASGLARSRFAERGAAALFAGCAAHSMLRLEQPISASFGLVLAMLAHSVGWPIARGGSQSIADALAAHLRSLGGEIRTSSPVETVDDLPASRALLLDLTPRQVLRIAGARLPDGYRRSLGRYRYGPGVFKLDWALDGPIPWTAPECRRAGTVHVGGTLEEIAASERAVAGGRVAERPFVLMAQPTLTDPSRAPAGKHVAWGYCHVPAGFETDMTDRIEAQIERFAPGFRDLVVGRSAMGPADVERHNPNYVGGDINGGAQDLLQLFTRPVPRLTPYATPAPGMYICSSSTPPGGGVHGMCGYHAARAALRRSL
jgi:phytoene dehydrogenase-like protein